MSIKKIVQIGALTVLLAAGSAAAQTAGSVNVSTTPVTSSVSAGSGVNLGTVTLTSVLGGGNVTSLPITITPSNGGQLSNLSNCQIFNNQGSSLTTGSNVVNTIGTGTNTFTLNAPLAVNPSTGTTTLSMRCNVASNTVSGSVFTMNAGTPALGPVLRVNLDTAPSVPAGSQDVTLANISVGATGANFNVTSIPLTISASSNGSVANLTDCKIRDSANLEGALSNVVTVMNGTQTTFALTSPLYMIAGGHRMLALSCDVQLAAAVGSTFTISVTPGNVTATNAATGAAVTPVAVAVGGVGPNGLAPSTSGTVIVSAAGTDTGTGTGTDTGTGTPGVPNTGLGGNAGLLAMIALAGLIALFGAVYLGRTKQA